MIARPMVAIIDDGHAMPYAMTFEWSDGSPGMAIRLSEDLAGNPTLVEMTHVASGRKINVELPFSQYLSTHTGANGEFADIAAMLASTATWTTADCKNGIGTDGIYSSWKKLPTDTTLTANGNDVRECVTGRLVVRTFVREPI